MLGPNNRYISAIKANEFLFNEQGIITEIVGTKVMEWPFKQVKIAKFNHF